MKVVNWNLQDFTSVKGNVGLHKQIMHLLVKPLYVRVATTVTFHLKVSKKKVKVIKDIPKKR